MLCIRLDLDYVPWDAANATKYGHGEPAMVIKLLDFARQRGLKFHFFISNRSLRLFPTIADAVLGEGHDLDWFCHYPDDPALFEEAENLFALAGHKIVGLATNLPWPEGEQPAYLEKIQFISAPKSPAPLGSVFFPVTAVFENEDLPYNLGANAEIDFEAIKARTESETVSTLVAAPQFLAKRDPHLQRFETLTTNARLWSIPIRTLRDALKG
jgi:hypothetical protein